MKQITYANPSREREFSPKRRERKKMIRTALALIGAAAVLAAIWTAARAIRLRPAEETAEEEAVSVGVGRALAGIREQEIQTAERERIETYTEGEGPAPEWYNPTEPMCAEWEESYGQVAETNDEAVSGDFGVFCGEAEQVRKDAGCPDWNLDTTLWGWDGHTAEPWELDLLARVFYLEFWGTSLPCSEAGCDAILNLWNTGNYGRTLYDALSSYDPKYGYTYRVYPHVWETDYNAEGLEWCREFCESRFYAGPEWGATYFRLGGYHDPEWVTPAYMLDGVYFSAVKGAE